MRRLKQIRGFTLIELMIVVAIVAILATIAYPSYQASVRKSRRVDAKSALTDIAQQQEAFYARNGRYTDDMQNLSNVFGNATWNNVPITSPDEQQFYQVMIVAEDPVNCPLTNCYVLLAQRRPGSDQVNDPVQNYELSSNGQRRHLREGGSWTNGWNEMD